MESELKILERKPTPYAEDNNSDSSGNGSSVVGEEPSTNDDRPLLKADSTFGVVHHGVSDTNIQELEKKAAAYVRNDVYGVMGRGELPPTERIVLLLALLTLAPLRFAISLTILVFYYSICRVCTLFSDPSGEEEQEDYAHMGGWRRTVIVQCGKVLSRALLFTAGFYRIKHTDISPVEGERKSDPKNVERYGAIISNHVSYLDILYHMSSSFPSFVAKRSVSKLPLVGLISKCLGCVFVQRESKSPDFKGVSGIVNERVIEAYRNKSAPMILLFPEGTTTNGDFILPFKTGAFFSRTPVSPVILRYPFKRFSPAWDSISGVRHVIFLLCQFVNYMEVIQLPVYYPSKEEQDDPSIYASNVRKLMAREGGNLTLSDVGLAEKRMYHAALNDLFCES